MKTNNKLFDFISASFGMHGKTIEVINKRKTDRGMRVSDVNHTKDGLSILKSYCDAYGDDVDAYKILEEVMKFESRYGDGTSLLTMLLVYLTKVNKEVPFSHEEIDSDIDYILSLINGTIVKRSIEDSDIGLYNWINTVCKRDIVGVELYNFYKENPKGIIKSIRRTDNPDRKEITFLPKQGYYMYSYMHKKFVHPSLKSLKDIRVVLLNDTLNSGLYNAYEDEAYKHGMKLFIIVKDTTEEVNELIEQTGEPRLIIARMPTDKELSYIYEDLLFMLNAKEIEGGTMIADVKEIQIEEESIKLFGFNRTKEELLEYTYSLTENFTSTEEQDKQDFSLRLSNILSNDTFDILINTKTISRFRMLRGMIEDVYKSRINYDKGHIHGGMYYTKFIDQNKSSTIIKVVKEIYNMMHKGKDFSIEHDHSGITNNDNFSIEEIYSPVDLLANIKEIYEIVRAYMHSLIDTHSESINVEFKWFG